MQGITNAQDADGEHPQVCSHGRSVRSIPLYWERCGGKQTFSCEN
jgi:hypothetical protein